MKTNKKFFLDTLPPPEYLMMPALCLDISDRSVKYIELQKKNGIIFVRQFGLFVLQEGIIEKGEIKQKDKLVEFLKSAKKKLRREYIIASLPEEKVFLSKIKFPIMDEDKIREALTFQIEEYVPLSADEAIFDYEIIRKTQHKNDDHLHLNLAVFPKLFVENYRDAFVESGFTPMAFEMETQAFARAIVPKEETDNVMVVDFGRTRTTFAIVSEGKAQFAVTVATAGDEIEKAIVNNLGVEKSQVEKIKREKGFIKKKSGEKLFESIKPILLTIKDEAAKHINYWLSHYEGDQDKAKISKILLCGGESTLVGLAEFLSYELKMKVELGNPWVNVASFDDYIPEIEAKDSLAYATVIGLALRQWT